MVARSRASAILFVILSDVKYLLQGSASVTPCFNSAAIRFEQGDDIIIRIDPRGRGVTASPTADESTRH